MLSILLLFFFTTFQGVTVRSKTTSEDVVKTKSLAITQVDLRPTDSTGGNNDTNVENDRTYKWMNNEGENNKPVTRGPGLKKLSDLEIVNQSEVFGQKNVDLESDGFNHLVGREASSLADAETKLLNRFSDWDGRIDDLFKDKLAFWNVDKGSELSNYWSEVNMTANASSIIPTFSGRKLALLNPLKSFLNKIVKSFWFERMLQQRQPRCDFSTGSFLNLCGECVGGKTEKEENFGIDGCGICGGLCPTQDSNNCSNDEIQNCSRVERVEPGVLDIAGDVFQGFTVRLGSECPGACVLPPHDQLDCFLATHDDKILEKKSIELNEDETIFKLKMSRPDREGSYKLCCGGDDSSWCKSVLVVDSNRLIVNVREADLRLSKENQVVLSVSNLEAPVGLVCFVKSGNHLLQAKFTNELYGNKYNTRVLCPPFAPDTIGDLNIGVAYSFRAIDKLTGIRVQVKAESPKMEKLTVRQDLSGVDIEFDQNIGIRPTLINEQTKQANHTVAKAVQGKWTQVACAAIFTKESLVSFGKESRCRILLNKISVDFGKRPKINQGMKIVLAKKNRLIPGDVSLIDASNQDARIPSALSAKLMKVSLPKKIITNGGSVVIDETCGSTLRAAVIPPENGVIYKWSLGIGKIDSAESILEIRNLDNKRNKRSIKKLRHHMMKRSAESVLPEFNLEALIKHHPEVADMLDLFKRIKHHSPQLLLNNLTWSKGNDVKNYISLPSNVTTQKPAETTNAHITKNTNHNTKDSPKNNSITTEKKKELLKLSKSKVPVQMLKKSQELIDGGIITVLEQKQDLTSKSFKTVHKDAVSVIDEVSSFNEIIDNKNTKALNDVENDFIDIDEYIKNYLRQENTKLSPGQIQRRNLKIWKSVRQAEKQFKQGNNIVFINKTLLIPGIEYSLKAEALVLSDNSTKSDNAERKIFTVGQTTGVWREKIQNHTLNIMGPAIVNPLSILTLQARTDDCTQAPTSAYRYEWHVESNGSVISTDGFRGSTLRIQRGTLSQNTIYNVSVALYNAQDVAIAWGTAIFYSTKGQLTAQQPIKEISLGTGHDIIIDAKDFLPPDQSAIRIEWSCQTLAGEGCHKVGPEREIVAKQKGNILKYPKGTLPVGQYKITAKGMWENEEVWLSQVELSVVRGDTPNLQISQGEGGWTAKVKQTRPGCFLSWYPIPTKGCQTIHSKDLGQKLVEIDKEAEVVLGIEKYVNPGSCYQLEVTAECREGRAKVRILIKSSNTPKATLKMKSGNRQAISTKFIYDVSPVESSENQVVYRFGYENEKGKRFLHASVEDSKFYSYFPQGEVSPFVEICSFEDSCFTAIAEKINVTMPVRASQPALDEVILRLEDEIKSKYFETSLGNLQLLGEALGEGTKSGEMHNATLAVEYILANAMFDSEARLSKRDEQLWGAKLLQLVTSVSYLPATEKFTSIMLDFRDRLSSAVGNTSIVPTKNPEQNVSTTILMKTSVTTPSTTTKATAKSTSTSKHSVNTSTVKSSTLIISSTKNSVQSMPTSKSSNQITSKTMGSSQSTFKTTMSANLLTSITTSSSQITFQTTNSYINNSQTKNTVLNNLITTKPTAITTNITQQQPKTEATTKRPPPDLTTKSEVHKSLPVSNRSKRQAVDVRDKYKRFFDTVPRSKRDSKSKEGDFYDVVDIVAILMQTSQKFISSSKNQTQIIEEKRKFIMSVPTYSVELCNDATHTNPLTAKSEIAILSAEKIMITGQRHDTIMPPCTGTCMNETLQVILGKQFVNAYKGHDGVCLAGAYFPEDLLDSNNTSLQVNISVSGIYRVDLLPYQGQLVSTEREDDSSSKKIVAVKIPIRINKGQTLKYQCETWNSSSWTGEKCRTGRQKTSKGILTVVCRCPLPAYYRVVALVNSTIANRQLLAKNKTDLEMIQLYTLTFQLKNDYLKEVYGRKMEFENMLKKQISTQAYIPEESEIHAHNRGNILVVLRAVDKWVDNESHFARELSKKLTRGELRLTGLSGANLTLDAMSFNFTHVPIGDKMAPPILLTMVTTIFTVVFLVAALIALGAYIHYRKDIRTLNVSTKPFDKSPKQKYARLHDVASIENIEQALMKGRTNVDSGLILGVNSVKQYDNDLIQSKEIDLPTGAGTI